MAGKTLTESIAARRAASDQKKKPGPITTKIPITMKDVNGCAFTVMVDHNPTSTVTSTSDFAGIASDPIPIAKIDAIEYEGWLAVEEEARTTVDWTKHSTPGDDSIFTIAPLSQTEHTLISSVDLPFLVDSGATVHISPDRSDFLSLHPINS